MPDWTHAVPWKQAGRLAGSPYPLPPEWGHLTSRIRVTSRFHGGVKIWRGDIRPSIHPISGFGLIHVCLDPMHPHWSQTFTWTIDRRVIVWAKEKCIRSGAMAFWIKAWSTDLQLNHHVCISIPSGLNNLSQLMNERFGAISSLRALWCTEKHKGNFSPAGNSTT